MSWGICRKESPFLQRQISPHKTQKQWPGGFVSGRYEEEKYLGIFVMFPIPLLFRDGAVRWDLRAIPPLPLWQPRTRTEKRWLLRCLSFAFWHPATTASPFCHLDAFPLPFSRKKKRSQRKIRVTGSTLPGRAL